MEKVTKAEIAERKQHILGEVHEFYSHCESGYLEGSGWYRVMQQPDFTGIIMKLKNCPFCGSPEVTLEIDNDELDEYGPWDVAHVHRTGDTYAVTCHNCQMWTDGFATPEIVAKKWNTRP